MKTPKPPKVLFHFCSIFLFTFLFNSVIAQSRIKVIYDFKDGKLPGNIELIDSRCSIEKTDGDAFLSLETGFEMSFAGINFIAEEEELWDFSAYASFAVDVANYAEESVTIWATIHGYSKSTPGKLVQCRVPGAATLKPGALGVIHVDIYAYGKKLSSDQELIVGRGHPVGSGDLDPSRIKQLSINVSKSVRDWKFGIDNLRLETAVEVLDVNKFSPFVDSLGQYMHDNWPEKTASFSELRANAINEKHELANSPTIQDLDEFGGWEKGGKHKATGFFYTKKLDDRWWLIDPLGNLFFSHGVNGVGNTAATATDFREEYFTYLPDKEGEFSECWGNSDWAPHGFYKDHVPFTTFDFHKANLIRKYGHQWRKPYSEMTQLRFKAWGINTLGNWSASYMYMADTKNRSPYVVSGSSGGAKTIEGSTGWWRKFPDPFDKSFRESVRKSLEIFTHSAANDPYCIGFFVDNEQSWGDDITLSYATLQSPETQTSKIVLVDDLRNKYNIIENLNSSWKSEYESWNQVLSSLELPDDGNENVRIDLRAFYSKLVQEYFAICREEVKRIAPHQMYLGCRFSAEMMKNEVLQVRSQEYCDVITYNIYNLIPVGFSDKIDKPVIIGEFHFGALDRGVFHTGLWHAKNQDERAELYENFVKYSLAHPLIVGTHWFQYPAQALTGRGDGENFQIGFIDICDKPYPELIESVKRIGKNMYQIRHNKFGND